MPLKNSYASWQEMSLLKGDEISIVSRHLMVALKLIAFLTMEMNMVGKLFLNTQILACLWFLSRNKGNGAHSTSSGQGYRNRTDEILFIDARNEGVLINRRTKELREEDIQKIAQTYHEWRKKNGKYEDVKGFCNSAGIERVKELDYVLTPGRYVGLPDDEDDFDFNERFTSLKKEFEAQLKEEAELNKAIPENLKKVKPVGK